MSIKKYMIELSPEHIYRSENTESLTVDGFICPYCSGRGVFIENGPYADGYKEDPCPQCNGAKQLKAVVQISWLPSQNSNSNQNA